eukprot:3586914-Amphidinium_carterae.1
MNILTPTPVTETPVPTSNAQIVFSGTAHRLEADHSDESVSVDIVNENVNPIGVESKAVPGTPSPSSQLQPTSIPTESPASSSEVREPPEWDILTVIG